MNRREQLTLELRKDIGAAIIELMKEKPLDKITVDEISARANVGRATYYRQFQSKQEAISYKLHQDFLKYECERGISYETTRPAEYSQAFFGFIYSLRETNHLLIDNGCGYCIIDAMRYSFADIKNSSNMEAYYRDHFRAYGLLGMIEGWIEADYQPQTEEIAKLAMEYFYKI